MEIAREDDLFMCGNGNGPGVGGGGGVGAKRRLINLGYDLGYDCLSV